MDKNRPEKRVSGASLLPDEASIITALRARRQQRSPELRLGIGDDCALLRPKVGEELAITTDLSLENVHFRRDWHPPESVGYRCLARGLSDLAAMGARPIAAFLSVAVPPECTTNQRGEPSWLERFYNGLLALAEQIGVPLAGGDTAQSPSIPGSSGLVSADVVLVGSVRRKQALLRSTARPGDAIFVTGSLGGAAAELLALGRNPGHFAGLRKALPQHPHLYPEPRLRTGLKLVKNKLAEAAIDLSDGLSIDLTHLCEESHLSAEIEADAIPVHAMARLAESAKWTPSALDLALHGGEDYELLFTAPAKKKLPKRVGGVQITRIGRMKAPERTVISLIREDGASIALAAKGWQHFRK